MSKKKEKDKMIIIPLLSLFSHGGTRILIEIANYLVQKGKNVTIIVPKTKINTPFTISEQVIIKQINLPRIYKVIDHLIFLCILPFYFRKNSIVIANFFVTIYPVKIASIVLKIKYIYFVQDIESKYKGIIGSILNFLCNITYKGKNIITANTYLKKKLIAKNFPIHESINIGPANIFFTHPVSEKQKKYEIIYFLRHESWKRKDRFDKILEILKIQYNINLKKILCISQDENLLKKYEKICSCLKPKNDEDIIAQFDSSKVFLLTSDYEGFSLPPLEAMSRGLPVVLFECGGPSLYIEHTKNAFLVKNEEVELACQYLVNLIKDDLQYKSISKFAKMTSLQFQSEIGYKKLLDILDTF